MKRMLTLWLVLAVLMGSMASALGVNAASPAVPAAHETPAQEDPLSQRSAEMDLAAAQEQLQVFDAHWEQQYLLWDSTPVWDGDNCLIHYFEVELYYSKGETDEPKHVETMYEYVTENAGSEPLKLTQDILDWYGEGCYRFRVRAVSEDLHKVAHSDWSELSEPNYYIVPTEKLPAPVGLVWGEGYEDDVWVTKPGLMTFFGEDDTEYLLNVYCDGVPVDSFDWLYTENGVYTESWMIQHNWYPWNSGDYQFSVQAISNDLTVGSSDIVWSETWSYTNPGVTLSLSDVALDPHTMEMSWTLDCGDESLVDCYYVKYYRSIEDADGIHWLGDERFAPGEAAFFDACDEPGEYWYDVFAIPADITQAVFADESQQSNVVAFTGPAVRLDAPSDLQWGLWREGEERQGTPLPGAISFKRGATDLGEYDIEIRSVDEVWYGWPDTITVDDRDSYVSWDEFVRYPWGSGTYQFRVRARGDMETYNHSQWVVSRPWTYTAPAVWVPAPADARWEDGFACWTLPADCSLVSSYRLDLFYQSEGNDWADLAESIENIDPQTSRLDLSQWMDAYGPGQYAFEIYACSADITQALSSQYPAASGFCTWEGHPVVEEVIAMAEDDSVEVTVTLSQSQTQQMVCAAYDTEGRLLSMTLVEGPASDLQTMTLEGDLAGAAAVRLFLLDEQSAPLYRSMLCWVN